MSMRPLLLAVLLSACSVGVATSAVPPAATTAAPAAAAAETDPPPRTPPRRPIGGDVVTIPDLIGLTMREAMGRLTAAGHRGGIGTVDGTCQRPAEPGRVCGSDPAAGEEISTGATITLHLAPR